MTRLTLPYNEWEFVSTTDTWSKGDDLTWQFSPIPGVNANIRCDGKHQITVVLRAELELDEFDDGAAAELATQVVDRLAFETQAPLSTPCLRSKIAKNGRFSVSFATMRQVTASAPTSEILRRVSESNYCLPSPQEAAAYRLYRESLMARDRIAGFILLWNLLVMLERNERNADEAIKKHCPAVPLMRARNSKCITAVRDARDDVAHMVERSAYQARPDVAKLRARIEMVLPYLIETVRYRLQQHDP